uniref:DUF4220 domain-containing protein n=1 Tax=Oryza barthii TaxID=65489 RepID=A0A0D3HAS1_9ORYZ
MRLLTAAILLFIALIPRGIIKSLSLKQTGFNYMQDKSNSVSHRMDQKQLQETLKEMRFLISIMPETSNHYEIPAYGRLYILRYMPSQLCLDYVRSYKSRRQTLESFWRLDDSQLYRVIEDGLSLIFSRLYTEDSRVDYIYSWWPDIAGMNLFVFLCLFKAIGNTPLIIAIALFHTSHKEAYSGGDITVTFVLLYGTLFLEFSFLFKLLTFRWKWQWRSTVPQLSILRFFTHHKRHSKLMGIARWFRFSSLLYSRWGKEAACDSSLKITTLVRQHIKLGWNNTINDAETYKMFNDTTGEWTFNLHNCNQFLELMSPYPLDESVIIWHLATDLCFYIGGAPNHDNAKRSREISNYMVYLLFTNPDMLTVSSRKSLFKTGCRELEYLLSDDYHEVHSDDPQEKHSDDMECLAKQINDRLTSQSEDPIRLNYISTAWNLSKNLRELNEEKMWKVIQGVWVEILCFSAGRCQGVLHAKSLGSGGEYLSYVWFLQAYAGLETFPDKLQKTHLMSTFQSPQREFTQNTSRSDLT